MDVRNINRKDEKEKADAETRQTIDSNSQYPHQWISKVWLADEYLDLPMMVRLNEPIFDEPGEKPRLTFIPAHLVPEFATWIDPIRNDCFVPTYFERV